MYSIDIVKSQLHTHLFTSLWEWLVARKCLLVVWSIHNVRLCDCGCDLTSVAAMKPSRNFLSYFTNCVLASWCTLDQSSLLSSNAIYSVICLVGAWWWSNIMWCWFITYGKPLLYKRKYAIIMYPFGKATSKGANEEIRKSQTKGQS